MRAFVTGGTGLLGNNLVRQLAEQGWQVRALARSAEKAARMLGGLANVEIVEGDLGDMGKWAGRMDGCDALFHTAAYFRESFRQGSHRSGLEQTNVANAIRLFELAEKYGVGKIVHTSTNATIRKRPDGEVSVESDRMEPDEALNPYGRSKAVGDLAIEEFSRSHRVPIVTVHPAWMFGPGDAGPTGSGQLVLNFLGRKLPGSFPSGIDVVDARDAAAAMIRAADRAPGGERYILSAHYTSLEELFRILEKVSGVWGPAKKYPLPLVYFSAWMSERIASWRNKETALSVEELKVMTERKRTSGAKAVRELGLAYRPLEETLRDTVAWYRESGMGS
ncbi:NAD-dependent epimerase/dehydratase family protein [Cohnella xylanilytica]|uniref:NAD-dependent epimerase/dehydratase family protein n=1 Tax=Cohnella xylanilytica TaxID=557555 RepID=A0A841U3W0_9BACL|nr:NAD-dependent epimerase/dehydratase family protein [Cohnella xylanilytica]MBB6693818.1 NAD-dependent epimerase/dehydratase family protein [Cohnella xylanilytica]